MNTSGDSFSWIEKFSEHGTHRGVGLALRGVCIPSCFQCLHQGGVILGIRRKELPDPIHTGMQAGVGVTENLVATTSLGRLCGALGGPVGFFGLTVLFPP